MNYADIRSEIKSGDILAFSHTGIKNFHDFKVMLVRMFTRSEYSHVATAWVTGGRVFVIEAVIPRVRIFPLSKLGDFYWIKTDVTWHDYTEELALGYVGNQYSVVQAVESFFGEPKADNKWECAELVKMLARNDGLMLESHPTPSNIVKELQELGKQAVLVKNPL